jgi:hypothetical protein
MFNPHDSCTIPTVLRVFRKKIGRIEDLLLAIPVSSLGWPSLCDRFREGL